MPWKVWKVISKLPSEVALRRKKGKDRRRKPVHQLVCCHASTISHSRKQHSESKHVQQEIKEREVKEAPSPQLDVPDSQFVWVDIESGEPYLTAPADPAGRWLRWTICLTCNRFGKNDCTGLQRWFGGVVLYLCGISVSILVCERIHHGIRTASRVIWNSSNLPIPWPARRSVVNLIPFLLAVL